MIFLQNLLELLLEAAPWLVLGLALGGLMKALIPTAFLQRHLSTEGPGSIMKAALLGAPLPLCSCGVIPAALGLRKAGASKPATASFLVSTPETGVDSISITYALLGPFMAIVRPIAALISAMVSGTLVAVFDPEDTAANNNKPTATTTSADSGCCGTEQTSTPSKTVPETAAATTCCSANNTTVAPTASTTESWLNKAWGGIHYAFTKLLGDIIFWLMIGLLFAALVKTFLPPDFLAQWGSGLIAMLVMMLAGIPMYICATASTPVAAGLMMAGVSPGVALVLMLTGPATNISTLGVIHKELGRRSMWLYLLGVGMTAILTGLLVDFLVRTWGITIDVHHQTHDMAFVSLQWLSLALLTGTALLSLRRR